MGMNIAAVNLYTPLTVSASLGSPLTDQTFIIWKTTRVLKSAGWIYKGSGEGLGGVKDTTGNPLLDKWGPGGIVTGHVQLGSQTGAAATIGTITQEIVTINGLTGMTANSVGHALTLSGAVNSANNGTFTIVAFNSATSVNIFNAGPGVAEGTSLTWSERVSGSATINWSAPTAVREQIITGLSGMTTSSAGHYLYLSGSNNANNNGTFQILKYISATSVVIINSAGVLDSAANANWTELDPLLDLYTPISTAFVVPGNQSWIVLQGPSTLKIPISAASTGTFTTGENITQSISSAQGELVGYQFDAPSNQGYLVVMPRQDGYGSGVHGWSTLASTITGGTSGATVTTALGSTPVEYVRESVFYASGRFAGSIFHCVVDGYTESTSRFSSVMLNAGCTASVQPGGGASGSGNTFPPSPGAFVVKGTGSSLSGTQTWMTSSGIELGRVSVFAANASYTAGVSADGTWTAIQGFPLGVGSFSPWGQFIGLGFWRVDNSEPGDVDPYVWFLPANATAYNDNRLGPAGSPTAAEHFSFTQSSTSTWMKGTRRRGFSTGDMMQQFQFVILGPLTEPGFPLIFTYAPDPDAVATSLSSFPPRVKEPIWVVSTQTSNTINGQPFGRMRKGTLRWGYTLAGFSGTDTFENKKYVQVSSTSGIMTLGPWDGYSTLYQT